MGSFVSGTGFELSAKTKSTVDYAFFVFLQSLNMFLLLEESALGISDFLWNIAFVTLAKYVFILILLSKDISSSLQGLSEKLANGIDLN